MEVLAEAPKITSFVPLAEHLTTTPASFYTGPPVLHYYSDRCKLVILESELSDAPALSNLVKKSQTSSSNDTAQNGGENDLGAERTVEDIDIWVTSDKLFLYANSLNTGVSIPYPSISLHAIQSLPTPTAGDTSGQGLYMQLISPPSNPATNTDEDDLADSISLTLIPTASAPPVSALASTEDHADAAIETESQPEQTPVQALFTALSNCSNLHPDPTDDDDEAMEGQQAGLEGSRLFQAGLVMPGAEDNTGLPPPMPGSGGWITAENMHEYFDSEGNWIGPEDGDAEMGDDDEEEEVDGENGNGDGLGPGAGTVRPRDGHANGNGDHDDETKWRRMA